VVTLRDVAKRAGVSIKTVSRIVNGDDAVNAKTRAFVQQHLKTLNYVPNHAARQMRNGASSLYGLMTDAVATTPYSVDIVRGAQSALTDPHQTLMIASSDGDPLREAELWDMFRAHRVAGVIYAAMFHRPHVLQETEYDQEVILANCFATKGKAASIIPDDAQGGYTQAQHVLKLGHRRIGVITLIDGLEATRLRQEGMRRAFAEAGVPLDESLVMSGYGGRIRAEESHVFERATAMLRGPSRPTAILCANDQAALQVYCAAAALGLSIPQDLSVIGFDDMTLISETLYPKLTTVALPYFEIGRRAATMLNDVGTQRDAKRTYATTLVACPLIERDSCRALH
jgi:LacI family transcriptional regulator